ncbi:uncharacterized protein LOC123513302 isoform X2 [Portunus trituberculatus]|uniref:uncharacterized protein LOC123513302 isoform X2 n=1 Tax=Portunus trituberculatus TaxID=210409 RepID=UPI001E1D16D3|nr:uncharacterized protein LOC123513302 isoform X2 [Portunus trituberculatus]XP_045126329.1 uncharacterized protein LOC123513302 isoform X2 [Portunus trituberculatus]
MLRNRTTILSELTSQRSRESSGEDLTIEWSSSDEEVIQSICPPPVAYQIGVGSSMNDDQYSEKCKDSIQSGFDQGLFSRDQKGHISLQKPDDEKSLSTCFNEEKKYNCQGFQSFLPSLKHHDLSKLENEMYIGKSESLLPISGRYDGALSCTNASDINVLEPQSPVLGSGRVWARSCSPVLRRKVQMKTSFDVQKKELNFSNALSVKRRINSDDVSFNLELSAAAAAAKKKENMNVDSYNGHSLYSNIRMRDFNVHDTQLDKCIFHSNSVQNRKTQSPEKIHCSFITPRDCKGGHTSSDCLDEVIHFGSHGRQDDSITLDVNLKPLLKNDLSLSEEHLELDIGECTSESIAVTMKGRDDQLDHNTKASMNDIDISEENESSAPATSLLVLDSNTRSGFDWVKHLQTPKKLLNDDVDGMESTKKKLLKEGQAQHLKIMLMSWRSCITLWRHRFSLTSLCGISPKQSLPLYKIHHHDINTNDVVKMESQEQKCEMNSICSPSVKNLQDLMIDNTASSAEILWSSSYKVSSKYLDLRLINIGGQLPSNAALCEAIGSNVEEFPVPVETDNKNVEAAEKRKTKKFFVFFALDEHNITSLHKFNTVRIYATWQNLSVLDHDIPTLFTSYYKFNYKEETTPLPVHHRRSVLHTWTSSG